MTYQIKMRNSQLKLLNLVYCQNTLWEKNLSLNGKNLYPSIKLLYFNTHIVFYNRSLQIWKEFDKPPHSSYVGIWVTRQLLPLRIHRSMPRGVHVNSCKIIDKWFNGTRERFGRRDCATRDYHEISIERACMHGVASLRVERGLVRGSLTTSRDCFSPRRRRRIVSLMRNTRSRYPRI